MKTAIVLFVYRREDKVKRLVESLLRNLECKESDLIIYSDAAENVAARKDVEAVRRYISEIKGFSSIYIRTRENNYGIERNEIEGLNEVFLEYDAAIVLEDDLEVAPDFLGYMYRALDKYRSEKKVNSITGYSYFMLTRTDLEGRRYRYLPDYGFIDQICSWGWGTWRDRWECMKNPISDADIIRLKDARFRERFDCNYGYYETFLDMYHRKNITWDFLWYFKSMSENRVNLMPKQTYVNNIGKDGSGVHYTEKVDLNDNSTLDETRRSRLPDRIEADIDFQKMVRKNLLIASGGRLGRLKRGIKQIFDNIENGLLKIKKQERED